MAYQTTFEQSVTMQIVFLDSDTIPNPLPVPTWATQWTNRPATAPGAEAAIRDGAGDEEGMLINSLEITGEAVEASRTDE